MVERLIQTIKRRLAVLDIDPNWTQTTLSNRLANIIENIRLIPNATTKTSPFEAHFGRKPNTKISNIITTPSHKNLSYNKLRYNCLDKKILKHDVLTNEELWKHDGLSEDDLDISYKDPENPNPINIESDESDNVPLRQCTSSQKSPRKITPSELHFTIGDKTTKIIANKRNIARKTLTRKAKEPRPTLAPQLNIIPDGTITNYTPHTITIDTPLRKNTVIRKNDIAITTETKPRLIHTVACKTVGEYKRNKEKIRKFCLEEERNKARQQESEKTGQSKWTHESIKQLAQTNQIQQQRGSKRKQTPSPSTSKKPTKRTTPTNKSPTQAPLTKRTRQQPTFNLRAQQAAMNYAAESKKPQQKTQSKTVHFVDNIDKDTVIYNIESEIETNLPFKIITSSSERIFTDLDTSPNQEPQQTQSEDELQSECPISIIPAPKREAEDDQQLHTEPNTVSAAPKQPKVVFLDTPQGEDNPEYPKETSKNANIDNESPTTLIQVEQEEYISDPTVTHTEQDPSTTPEGDPETTSATSPNTQSCETPSGTSSVYATPPVSPNAYIHVDQHSSD